MKRALRVVFAGPLVLFMVLLMTAAYPLVMFLDWLFDTPRYPGAGCRDLWRESMGKVWNG